MRIDFFVVINKNSDVRLSKFFFSLNKKKENNILNSLYSGLIKINCKEINVFSFENYNCYFREYQNLFFVIGSEIEHNFLLMDELIELTVKIFDSYFKGISEKDFIENPHLFYMVIDEMFSDGYILSTNQNKIIDNVKRSVNN